MDAIRSGWLSKENSKSVFTIKVHVNRWVVLYPHKIVMSHEPDGSKPEECREIPLRSIVMNSPRVSDQPNSSDFSLDCGDRIYTFRAKTAQEASEWKRDINLAVFKCAANELKPAKTAESAVNPDSIIISPHAQRYEEGSEIGKLLTFVTYTQINVMHTAERFFKCIKHTPAKQRSNMAKAMGKAMVLWVGDEANSGEVQPLRHHNNKYIAPAEVLNIWIRVALARELNTSCKFELQAGDSGSVASSAGSTANSNRSSTRRLSQNKSSTIMPFRADSPECLFLSSLVNATAIRSQMLFRALLPVLQPLNSNAEGFIYPPIQMMRSHHSPASSIGTAPSSDAERRPSIDVSVDGTTNNSSSSGGGGVFSRMMSGLRGNNTTSGGQHQRNASITASTAPSTRRNSFNFSLNRRSLNLKPSANNNTSSSGGNGDEDPYQKTIISVRNNIYGVIKELFLMLHGMDDSEYPSSLISLMLTVKDLTIDAKNNGLAMSAVNSGSNTTDSSPKTITTSGHHTRHQPLPSVEENKLEDEASSRYADINDLVVDVLDGKRDSVGVGGSTGTLHDEADLHDQLVRFACGRYYTSCTALVFLRLICPSIINPSDWMLPLSGTASSGGSSAAHTSYETKDADAAAAGGSGGGGRAVTASSHGSPCAAMIILSHVIGESSTFSGDGGKHSLDPHISGVLPIPVEEAMKMIEKDALQVKAKPGRPFIGTASASGHHYNQQPAELNLMNMTVRKGLAEISKALLHISNIACLPRDEMEVFARDSLVRSNVSSGLVDKDHIDHYQLTEAEKELVTTQLMLANEIQLLYERLGKLARVNW